MFYFPRYCTFLFMFTYETLVTPLSSFIAFPYITNKFVNREGKINYSLTEQLQLKLSVKDHDVA